MDKNNSLKKNAKQSQKPQKAKKKAQFNIVEFIIEKILQLFAIISILTTLGIVVTLFTESISFFQDVSMGEFLFGKVWRPLLKPVSFGVLPLIGGTLLIAVCSSILALPVGLATAIYLSEYAPSKVRKIVKPILEVLAGIPSVVYGYFALTFITPVLQAIYPETEVFNALSASIALGIMILPMVASLSEDAMMAIPDAIRNGAYALGSTKLEVATKIVVPASISGIVSAFVLAISRAIGETMIVAIAAGASPKLTINPFESVQTMTGYMVNVALGDIQHGTVMYKTVFAVGAVLFVITFVMNVLAKLVVKRYGEV